MPGWEQLGAKRNRRRHRPLGSCQARIRAAPAAAFATFTSSSAGGLLPETLPDTTADALNPNWAQEIHEIGFVPHSFHRIPTLGSNTGEAGVTPTTTLGCITPTSPRCTMAGSIPASFLHKIERLVMMMTLRVQVVDREMDCKI